MECPDISDENKKKLAKKLAGKYPKFNGFVIIDLPERSTEGNRGEVLKKGDKILVTLDDIKFGKLPEYSVLKQLSRRLFGWVVKHSKSEIILSIKVGNTDDDGKRLIQETNLGEIKYVKDYDKLNIHNQVIFQGELNSPALQFDINILDAIIKRMNKIKGVAVPGIMASPSKDTVSALSDLLNSVLALNADDQLLNYKFSLFTEPIAIKDGFPIREGTYTIRKVWNEMWKDEYNVCLKINIMKN